MVEAAARVQGAAARGSVQRQVTDTLMVEAAARARGAAARGAAFSAT